VDAVKIVLVHNSYQNPGGEDVVFSRECDLLLKAGHQVSTYIRSNLEITNYNWQKKASLGARSLWAWDSKKELQRLLTQEKPDVAHFHNTFPLISPAAYSACRRAGVAVIQTLHNPRLLCPAATLTRNGALCEACLQTSVPWPALAHACYRNSRAQTAVVAAMLVAHRLIGTWARKVDRFVASTDFYAQKFIAGGLPAAKVVVKPHFVERPDSRLDQARDYALFVGRLSPEKGLDILLRAWRNLPNVPLKVRGDGPMLPLIKQAAAESNGAIEWIPRLSDDDMTQLFGQARFLVWPSLGYYETFGLVAIEAFAFGTPVIASGMGAMGETVRNDQTGLHFTSGDPEDLASKVEWAWNHPAEMRAMGDVARLEYETQYTPERNYRLLMAIYESAIAERAGAERLRERAFARTAVSQ
jgi:glycosyltransferase involved in cell wall biosynthesis